MFKSVHVFDYALDVIEGLNVFYCCTESVRTGGLWRVQSPERGAEDSTKILIESFIPSYIVHDRDEQKQLRVHAVRATSKYLQCGDMCALPRVKYDFITVSNIAICGVLASKKICVLHQG